MARGPDLSRTSSPWYWPYSPPMPAGASSRASSALADGHGRGDSPCGGPAGAGRRHGARDGLDGADGYRADVLQRGGFRRLFTAMPTRGRGSGPCPAGGVSSRCGNRCASLARTGRGGHGGRNERGRTEGCAGRAPHFPILSAAPGEPAWLFLRREFPPGRILTRIQLMSLFPCAGRIFPLSGRLRSGGGARKSKEEWDRETTTWPRQQRRARRRSAAPGGPRSRR